MPDPLEAFLHVLWTDRYAGETEVALLDRFGGLLTDEERARQARPGAASRRREILLGRMLARTALSHHTGVDPRDWRFDSAEGGRPFIASPRLERRLDFNLSHTEGVIVCLVAPLAEIGVDVEFQARQNDLDGLAAHYFAPSERDAMRVLPEAERRRRFFDYWTLKEAYIKARGKGLALPLDAFWFDLDGAEPAIAFDSRIADEPARWRFETIALSPSHLCSVALPVGPGARPVLRVTGARDRRSD